MLAGLIDLMKVPFFLDERSEVVMISPHRLVQLSTLAAVYPEVEREEPVI